jgi:N-acetylmuramoyl-L-alanine amidase
MKKYFALFVLVVLFYGCSSGPAVYYDVPREFLDTQLMNNSISDCSSGLSGLKIFLDPGHGGEDRKNTGPMGIAIEADVNLRFSLYLRSFLEQAGATVFLSRDIDKTVSLKDRSIMANQSGADIFISVHHNAPEKLGIIGLIILQLITMQPSLISNLNRWKKTSLSLFSVTWLLL